jgi:hypothetical protein
MFELIAGFIREGKIRYAEAGQGDRKVALK